MRARQYSLLQLVISACLLFFASLTFAERPPLQLTLYDTIMLSLRFNPTVQTEDVQRISDKMSLLVAQWGYQLQYQLTGTGTYNNAVANNIRSESNSQSITPGMSLLTPLGTQLTLQSVNPISHTAGAANNYNPSVVFSLTQPLLQGSTVAVVMAPLHLAENQELLNRLTMENTVIQTVTTAISQYASLVQAQNSITAQELSLKQSIATLNQEQAFVKTGRSAPADLVQFQASVASQQLSLEQQQVNLTQQKQQLLITLGIDPTLPFTVTKQIKFTNETLPSLKESIRLGLKHNIAYQQAIINMKIAKINLLLGEDKQRWTLNLVASHVQGAGSGGPPNAGLPSLVNGRNYNNTVTLNLTVPLDNLTNQQVLVQAKVALNQQRIALDAQKRLVINSVTSAYDTVINQKAQITQAKIAMDLAQKTLDISQAKLKYGRSSPFEVSTLQSSLVSQQLSYINTIAAYYTNLATFDQIVGITLQRWKICVRY